MIVVPAISDRQQVGCFDQRFDLSEKSHLQP